MASDPSKQGYNNYGSTCENQHPSTNQPQLGTSNVYLPNDSPPPPYSQYSQRPPDYQPSTTRYYDQPPLYQHQGVIVTPVYQPQRNSLIVTSITSKFKTFLIISGILSLIWGIVAIGLEVGFFFNYVTTYYRGLWAGGFLIGGGISMLITACRAADKIYYLHRLFIVTLLFVLLGLILSIVNLVTSVRCEPYYGYNDCDTALITNLKITILVLFVITTIHTIINIIMAYKAQKITIAVSSSNVPEY